MKTREPGDEQCVSWCTYTKDNIHDPIPLDNPKNHTALLYITWGLVWDLKNKERRRDPSYKILLDRHPRLEIQISEQEGKERKNTSEKAIKFQLIPQGHLEI